MNARLVIFSVISLAIGLILGLSMAKFFPGKTASILNTANQAVTSGGSNSVFSSQTASVQGKVTSIKDGKLTVVNDQNQQSGTFMIGPNVSVIKVRAGATNASPSADINTVEINAPAVVSLNYQDGQFQVVAVMMLPPLPSGPPPGPLNASPSAIKAR